METTFSEASSETEAAQIMYKKKFERIQSLNTTHTHTISTVPMEILLHLQRFSSFLSHVGFACLNRRPIVLFSEPTACASYSVRQSLRFARCMPVICPLTVSSTWWFPAKVSIYEGASYTEHTFKLLPQSVVLVGQEIEEHFPILIKAVFG